jgi:hypothetical protein
MSGADLFFDLRLPRLGVSARWAPTAGERGVCREIVARVRYRVPSADTDPWARYAPMAKFFDDAAAVVREAAPDVLPSGPGGVLPADSLAVLLLDAVSATRELLNNGLLLELGEDTVRRFADELQPEVLEFRRAVGEAGGAAREFWTTAGPGETPVWTVRARADAPLVLGAGEPEPRKRRWFGR